MGLDFSHVTNWLRPPPPRGIRGALEVVGKGIFRRAENAGDTTPNSRS